MNKKSHVLGHVIVLRIFGALKSCAFGGTFKRCSINSTSQVELKKMEGHVRSHVRCKGFCLTKVKKGRKARDFNRNFLRV